MEAEQNSCQFGNNSSYQSPPYNPPTGLHLSEGEGLSQSNEKRLDFKIEEKINESELNIDESSNLSATRVKKGTRCMTVGPNNSDPNEPEILKKIKKDEPKKEEYESDLSAQEIERIVFEHKKKKDEVILSSKEQFEGELREKVVEDLIDGERILSAQSSNPIRQLWTQLNVAGQNYSQLARIYAQYVIDYSQKLFFGNTEVLYLNEIDLKSIKLTKDECWLMSQIWKDYLMDAMERFQGRPMEVDYKNLRSVQKADVTLLEKKYPFGFYNVLFKDSYQFRGRECDSVVFRLNIGYNCGHVIRNGVIFPKPYATFSHYIRDVRCARSYTERLQTSEFLVLMFCLFSLKYLHEEGIKI